MQTRSAAPAAPTPQDRGFRKIAPARLAQIAAMGGRAAHQKGKAHQFTSEEAAEAGRLGGLATAAIRKAAKAMKP